MKHDVIAFLTSVNESIGESARFLHRGMTSNDLLDTSFGYLLGQAGGLISKEIDSLMKVLRTRAEEFRSTPCIGRSHGIHAEPTTFGLKLLSFYKEIERRKIEFSAALEGVKVGKIAGAVGTFASVSPTVEAAVLGELGLKAEDVPSQIVHRDRHAQFFSSLALLGSSLDRVAVELRHLQRTEVGEVEEGFSKGQKGSSAMPHKKNPISAENISGLSRLLRGYSVAAMENVALWHERDISHSSVERVIAPDATTVAHYMLLRMNKLIGNLVVHADRMMKNLEMSRGLIYSGTLLIALADSGMSRESAYALVQKHAMATWEGGPTFQERVLHDEIILKSMTESKVKEVFDISKHLRHVNTIFERSLSN